MFQVINLNQEVERECPTRAELMYFLEGEEKRCLSTNTSETFRLLHFDRNGEVLEAKEITIPPSGEDKELKDLLADFGFKKGASFWNRLSPQTKTPKKDTISNKETKEKPKRDKVSPTTPQTVKKEVVATPTTSKRPSLLVFLALMGTILSLGLSSLTYYQVTKLQANESHKQTQTMNQGADVFSRYFISYYFTNKEASQDFVSKAVDLNQMDLPQMSIVSVLLEKEEVKGQTATLTYVLNCRYEDGSTENKRLTLTVKESKDAKYGYLVTKAPELTAYP